MPSIFGFVVKEALDSNGGHPPLDSKRCINSKQGRVKCSACSQICAGGAIVDAAKGKADWSKCISCGLCTVVCPSGALGFADYKLSRMKKMLSDNKETHTLSCPYAQADADGKAWCVASYHWEQIAALALQGKVEIIRGDCANCERREKLACFDQTLEQVHRFLGDEVYNSCVVLREKGECAPKEVSRRELFGKFIPSVRKKRAESGFQAKEYGTDGLAVRRMLADVVKLQEEPEREYTWLMPAFTDSCWACGICSKVCPNEAIKPKEKDGVWRMVCSPMKCTGCGICENVCMYGGIKGLKEVKLAAGKRVAVHKVQAQICPECGAAVQPGSEYELCLRCRAIQKNKKKK